MLACIVAIMQPAILLQPWGALPLSVVMVATFLIYRPQTILHPNIAIFAFYFLWFVLPSTLTLILDLTGWEYNLAWSHLGLWGTMSAYTLFQVQVTFLTLFLACHYLGDPPPAEQQNFLDTPDGVMTISNTSVIVLSAATLAVGVVFMQLSGGWERWLTSYSITYLRGRQGLGALNLAFITLGNLTVFILGLRNYANRGGLVGLIPALIVILPLGFLGGFKSRLIFLVFLFALPYLLRVAPRIPQLVGLLVAFVVTLYLLTLVRTSGYYSSPQAFLEMMTGYFNSYPLHEQIVASRDPAFFQTVFQVFVKPLQVLGLVGADADFDISVMLTKEFFPDQWNLHSGTQQWPLETDLYLNYFGVPFQWVPLFVYALVLSWLFRSAVIRQNFAVMPIYALEFLRIISTLRGALIPWNTPIILVQYGFIFLAVRSLVRPLPVDRLNVRTRARDNADLVYNALTNERAIDLHFITKISKDPNMTGLPPYKAIKLVQWRKRFGLLFWPAVAFAAAATPFLVAASWVKVLMGHKEPAGCRLTGYVGVTKSPAGQALIRRGIDSVGSGEIEVLPGTAQDLAARLTRAQVLRCAFDSLGVIDRILVEGPGRIEMLLHARDAFELTLLAEVARENPEATFVTDSHYQRQAYILSHRAGHFWIVQHGYLYADIDMPEQFGVVERLICRDEMFVPMFEAYYKIQNTSLLVSAVTLRPNQWSQNSLLVASSSVSIDLEIAFLQALRERSDIPVIVKLHPLHVYDERAETLTAFAVHVAAPDEFPDCRLLVTFNSFMEFDYRAIGKKTISIERAGSVERALSDTFDVVGPTERVAVGTTKSSSTGTSPAPRASRNQVTK